MKPLLFLALLVAIALTGCGLLAETHTVPPGDPLTVNTPTGETKTLQPGEQYKTMTPAGEEAIAGATTVLKVVTGPLGIPPEIIDWLIKMILGWAGIVTLTKGAKRLKDSEPGAFFSNGASKKK